MKHTMLVAAAIGGLAGLAAGLVGARWFVEPGRGLGRPGTLRGDLDAVEERSLVAAASELAARKKADDRIAALERALAAASPSGASEDVRAALAGLAADLAFLRDSVRADLQSAGARLSAVESRLHDLELTLGASSASTGPLSDEEEAEWLTKARDPDPMKRFSALYKLSRTRTDRSVRCAVDALGDPNDRVVWQALRNLGTYQERPAAREAAVLLDHAVSTVRQAAFDALLAMGAPKRPYEAYAPASERRATTEALRKWAAEVQ